MYFLKNKSSFNKLTMSYTIFTQNAIQNSNLITKATTTFLQISSSKVNLYGSLGIGTDILFTNMHVNNVNFDMNIKISNENKIRSSTYNTYYALLPIGSIILYSSSSPIYYNLMINNGWIECDGRTVSLANYPLLEPLLRDANYYNNGPYPQANFNVPNFTDRIPIGASGILTSNDINSVYTNTMNINQIPKHKHNIELSKTLGENNSLHSHEAKSLVIDGDDISAGAAGTADGLTDNSTYNFIVSYSSHNHEVMLPGSQDLNSTPTPINIRHSVKYILYFIKGR